MFKNWVNQNTCIKFKKKKKWKELEFIDSTSMYKIFYNSFIKLLHLLLLSSFIKFDRLPCELLIWFVVHEPILSHF